MAAAGWSRVFVKPAHGSSASGVIALALGPRCQLRAVTAVEVDGDRLFNSLRVREYREEAVVASIVDRLAGMGCTSSAGTPRPCSPAGRWTCGCW